MRFLHTSDWHLGRTLHNVDLIDAQRSVLGQIVQLVRDPPDGIDIDAVLIAGDIYDRAVPPVEAVALFSEILTQLTRYTTVIVTSGNHDSAIRLGFGSGLFTDRLHVHSSLADIGRPVLIGDAAVYPLPYLDPDAARIALADRSADGPGEPLARSHEAIMSAALGRVRQDLATRPAGTRSVVMAHAFVMGGAVSDSERSIVVGGVEHVPAELFAGLDYIALGHLHGAQQPASATATVLRYSGSPLRYSFSERGHRKGVTLVDLPPGQGARVTSLDLRQPREMAELRGPLEDLIASASFAGYEQSWVKVTVTDRARPERLFDRLQSRFPHVLQVLHEPAGAAGTARTGRATATSVRELGSDFVSYVSRAPADSTELDLFEQAYERAALGLGRSA
ncbi:exonuclease SbcCD subunit D [Jatrophihabitans telluris]|uniref:Nuclease SbcCD subunit D n=1 Tax=Jatrophihabitans telluris TaxID=2038343 RepID=A0ABY4QWI7_9ACTN|nr:exonuclease SbcCD subunit D [Jatrophihabitans telluris]UQX87833.1 exonuclease SbcCD subunit D [Jatrophihabitans telluris]